MRRTAARRILLNLVKDSLHTGALCDPSRGIRRLSNLSHESLLAITLCDTSLLILRLQNFNRESLQAITIYDTSRRIRLRMTKMCRTAARRILLNLI